MTANKWVIETATGRFLFGGFYDPVPPTSAHSVVTLPTETMPDPSTQKWVDASVVPMTTAEMAENDRKRVDAAALSASDERLVDALVDELDAAGLLGNVPAGLFKHRVKARIKVSARAKKRV